MQRSVNKLHCSQGLLANILPALSVYTQCFNIHCITCRISVWRKCNSRITELRFLFKKSSDCTIKPSLMQNSLLIDLTECEKKMLYSSMLTHSVSAECCRLKARGDSFDWSLFIETQLGAGQLGRPPSDLAEKHQTKEFLFLTKTFLSLQM